MSLKPVRTDEGIEYRDGDHVVVVGHTWPPRESEVVEALLEHSNISTPDKDLRMVLYGAVEPDNERSDSDQS